MFNYSAFDFPVNEIVPKVKMGLSERNTLIIKAPTGAGKSTLLPLNILDK